MLLRAVVEVALDRAPLRVAGFDDASARGSQLVGLAPHLVERLLECRVELDVVQRETDLARELGEHLVVVVVERQGALAAPHDDEPEQFTRVRDGRDAENDVFFRGHEFRQPDAAPRGTRGAGTRDDGLFLGPEREGGGTAIGDGDGAFEPSGRPAGPDLRALQCHGLLQRLGELEQQFVEGQRPREATPECAEYLIGRRALTVDLARRPFVQSLASGNPEQRGNQRRDHGQTEKVALGALRRVPEAEHDQQVTRGNEAGESDRGDRLHEQTVDPHRDRGCGNDERDRNEHARTDRNRADRVRPVDQRVEYGNAAANCRGHRRRPGDPLEARPIGELRAASTEDKAGEPNQPG